jgi:FkbM family methyltransferase
MISVRVRQAIKRLPIVGPLAVAVWRALRPRGEEVVRPSACYMGDGVVLAHVQGFKMFLPADDNTMAPHLILEGIWEQWVMNCFLRVLRPGMTVVDVGANVGYYTLLAARAVGPGGRVHAFEPEPLNFRLLKRSLMANGLHWVNASDKALWDEAGTRLLFTTTAEGGRGGHTLIDDPATSTRPRITVETITLDEVLAADRRVDVMKMDAEGAEPRIFDGMRRVVEASPRLKIVMEFSPQFVRGAGRDPVRFIDELGNMGFSVSLIRPDSSLAPFDVRKVVAKGDRDWLEMLFLER